MKFKDKKEELQRKVDSICELLMKQLKDINGMTEQARKSKKTSTVKVPVNHQQTSITRYH